MRDVPRSMLSPFRRAQADKKAAGFRRRQKEYRERLAAKKPKAAPVRRRRCKNCKALFWPTAKGTPDGRPIAIKEFCSDPCRLIFHRFGPGYDSIFKKLTAHVTKRIEEATYDHLKLLRQRIEELEKKANDPRS